MRSAWRFHRSALTRKKAIFGFVPLARSSNSWSKMYLTNKTAIRVFPEPNNILTTAEYIDHEFDMPVSSTAMMFCFLAFSKSSVWYSRGSVMITLDSCLDIKFLIDNASSSMSVACMVALTSSFVTCSERRNSLQNFNRVPAEGQYHRLH